MNLAIVCSWLNQYGGAERVLEVVHDMYPTAPVYTTVFKPDTLPDTYRTWDIRPSWLDRLPLIHRWPQPFLPLFPLGVEGLDLRGYDVVFSLTSAFAHGVITPAETAHVCYCLTPTRFLWSYHAYIEREGVGRLARAMLPLFLQGLRAWDRLAADRVDRFLAISRTVQARIAKYYRRESEILYPPVEVGPPPAADVTVGDYYLVVSRLVPYKRVDLAVAAFNQLGLPLRIAGSGRDRQALQAMAGPTVQFLGYVGEEDKRELMARCRAFIFPGEEDFGITPLEATAAGRPVIAYGAGGALDTVVEGRTGLFFPEATPASLADAVRRLEGLAFDPAELHAHAQQFDVPRFQRELDRVLSEACGARG